MDLNELRLQIDDIDSQIDRLGRKRPAVMCFPFGPVPLPARDPLALLPRPADAFGQPENMGRRRRYR